MVENRFGAVVYLMYGTYKMRVVIIRGVGHILQFLWWTFSFTVLFVLFPQIEKELVTRGHVGIKGRIVNHLRHVFWCGFIFWLIPLVFGWRKVLLTAVTSYMCYPLFNTVGFILLEWTKLCFTFPAIILMVMLVLVNYALISSTHAIAFLLFSCIGGFLLYAALATSWQSIES